MPEVPDYIDGLQRLLETDADLVALVESRIFGEELPAGEAASMPRKAIVVRAAGSANAIGAGYQDYGDQRVDFRAYGETPYEARRVYLALYPVLKHLRRQIHSGCLLHWARKGGGPLPMRDPDTDWPSMWSSWQVLVAEIEVS